MSVATSEIPPVPADVPHRIVAPTVLQMEAVECGAAALAIVMEYYGDIVPLTELREVCGVSRDGSKASNILKAARHYGFEAGGYSKELESLYRLPPPFIVFWNFNHFLVVEGFQDEWVYLSDPATGRRRITLAEFDQSFTGVVLTFKPGPTFQPGGSRPNLWHGLYRRLSGSLAGLSACLLAGLLLAVPNLALPIFTGQFIDAVLIDDRVEWLNPILWGMGVTAVLIVLLTEVQLRFLRRLQVKLAVGMSGRFLWHVLQLPMRFYAQRFAGDIGNRVVLNDRVANTLSGKLGVTVIQACTMVVFAAVMLAYDVFLTLIVVSFAACSFFVLQWVSRQRVDANRSLQQDFGKVAGVGVRGLQNIETLKASGLESDFFARWSGYYAKATNNFQRLGQQTQTLGVLPSLTANLSNTAILFLGGLAVMRGDMTLGGFVAFQQIAKQFLAPVNNLVSLGQSLQEMVGDLDRLDDVLANPLDNELSASSLPQSPQTLGGNAPPSQTPVRLHGALEVRNLTFGYNPIEPPLIENFSLQLEPGQRVALVGGSGSGKSTLANTICGLYQPQSGEILFDGRPRSGIDRTVLVSSVAKVDQEILLFGTTIRNNITLWDSTVADRDLVRAAKDAEIHEFILSLPQGYDTVLQEGGGNLSGGQRQRLEIARVLVGGPSVLVLDEATSALDAETELAIDRNLRRRSCTCVIVAHRLSTIRDCDEIIVLERGKVVQRGTHDRLWEEGGYYAELVRSEGA